MINSAKITLLPTKMDEGIKEHYKKGKLFEKLDVFILAFILVGVIIASVFAFISTKGSYAEVYYEGEIITTITLDTDKTLTLSNVQGSPTIAVKDGAIAVIENDCASQTCVKTGYISNSGERIVCAPNKLVIVVRGKTEQKYDAVTGGGGQ